jgi:hypothetical protein
MQEIECIDINGQKRTFFVEGPLNQTVSEATFRVHRRNPPRPNHDDWFEARFRLVSDRLAQSVMLHASTDQYRKMGIPEKTILFASRALGRKIVSSPVVSRDPGEFVVAPAIKAWKRLVARGLAMFSAERGRYELLD